jgi:hypothetical protein
MPFDGNVREFLFAFQNPKIVPNESCSRQFPFEKFFHRKHILANPSALFYHPPSECIHL